ncbi:MAG: cupin domain-containing protein [Blastocatellia bacterium]|jgi:quercetin dioxygenase-like cupin family protein
MNQIQHHRVTELPEERVTDLFGRKFFNGEQITLAFLTIAEGGIVPRHEHESEQFSYCISGCLRFQIGDEEVILRAGELVQIPAWVPHEAVVIEDYTGFDVFSPPRRDWIEGTDDYLRRSPR